MESVDQGERLAFGFWLMQGEPDATARGADDALDEQERGAGWRVSNLPACPFCRFGVVHGGYFLWTCGECGRMYDQGELIRRGVIPVPPPPREPV